METKTCTKCGETKPLDEFHKNPKTRDGRQPHCKSCRVSQKKKERLALVSAGEYRCTACGIVKPLSEFHVSKSLSQGHMPKCKLCRNAQDRDHRYANGGKPLGNPKDPKKAARIREFYLRNPLVRKGEDALQRAIKRGDMPRAATMQCEHCGKQAAEYHHHLGYEPEHWLHVVPLCHKCHSQITIKKRTTESA
jgi:NAD-dependent SIR2 family protein deacetylase